MGADKAMDVLIVGAGPVGLFCAQELFRQGLRCRIIDKKTGLSDKSKALGLHIRTLDVFADCGLIDKFIAEGHQVDGILFKSNGKELVSATFADIEANRHFIIDLPQDKTEKILYDEILSKGIAVEWQTELTNIVQNSDLVIATLTRSDGSTETIESPWVIACDGAHSTVRHLSNLSFEGSKYKQNWWLADLLIDWNLPENRMVIYISKAGPLACFPMGNKRYRVVMTAPLHDEDEPSMKDIVAAFNLRSSDEAHLSNPVWITPFSIHHRQIQHYRLDRIFFAGDAAHIHSPMGGQGLNTGIQDIYNLAWKLALVQKEQAKDSLLDSYHSERYPVGHEVLKKTDVMTKMVVLTNPIAIALRNTIISTMMSFRFIRNKVARQVAELEISYERSPIVESIGAVNRFKAGYFLADFNLYSLSSQNKQPLSRIVQGTMHHLFLFIGLEKANPAELITLANWISETYRQVIVPHLVLCHEIVTIDCTVSTWLDKDQQIHRENDIKKPCALLLRPDKYIGFAQTPVEQKSLLKYLVKIFK